MSATHGQPTHVDMEPKSKRKRTALACDSCRARKTRCDGARPCCGVCGDMDFRCVYTRPARVTTDSTYGIDSFRLEDRLRAMEEVLRSVVSKTGVADPVSAAPERWQEKTPPRSSPDLFMGGAYGRRDDQSVTYTAGIDILANDAPLDDTVDGMGVITFADEVGSGYFGPTSNSAFFSRISNAVRVAGLSIQSIAPAAGNVAANCLSRPLSPRAAPKDRHRRINRPEPVDCFALPREEKIIQLVDLFFSSIGLLFPYIYKKHVLDGLHDIKMTNFYGVRRSWLCLLNTIMAFATCVTTGSDDRKANCTAEAEVFLQRALKLLPNLTLKPATLEAFQALLLVTQYLQGTQHSAQTWKLQGLTVQAAFQIGVHCGTAGDGFSPLEQEIRLRCWYMCFILDKTCSMTFGRPASISNEHIRMDLPLDVDFQMLDVQGSQAVHQAADQHPSTALVFIHSINLYKIVADIIEKAYRNNYESSASSDHRVSSSNLFQQIIAIEARLAKWKIELPRSLAIKTKEDIIHETDGSSVISALSTVMTLRYINTRTLLHRPIMVRFLDFDAQTSGSGEEWSFLETFGRASFEVCLRSAVEMIDILYTASKARHLMLTTWWFSLYYVFSSALVIFATMVIMHKHNVQISGLEAVDLTNSLQRALDALEKLGDDTRIARRCRKYLSTLLHVASTTSLCRTTSLTRKETLDQAVPTGTLPGVVPINDQNGGRGGVNGMAMPLSDLSEFSPLSIDLGPFVAGCDWDIFTNSMHQEYLNLPFPE